MGSVGVMAPTAAQEEVARPDTVAEGGIVVGGLVELVMTSAAVRDLVRRPATDVRGPKPLWLLTFLVQPVGPIAYFLVGRRARA